MLRRFMIRVQFVGVDATSTQGQKKFNLGAHVWKPAEWFL